MNNFIFCTSHYGGAGRITIHTAGVNYEMPNGMYEAYVTSEDKDIFLFNMEKVVFFPVEHHNVTDISKFMILFEKVRPDLLRYAQTQDKALWWELKGKINSA